MTLTKSKLIVIILILAVLALGAIFGLRAFLSPENPNQPLIVSAPLLSGTPGIEVWTGELRFEENIVQLTVDGQKYELIIPAAKTSDVLQQKGYKTGDQVNVMGKLSSPDAKIIELSGINQVK